MKIGTYSIEEYLHLIRSFHGSMAPGLIIGGFMVDLAQQNLPKGEFYDALCETRVCLPDAVQILTPCTIGNGWLKIFDTGRFALTMYEKSSGEGVRVYMDTEKLKAWPQIDSWYFKRVPKREQDSEALLNEIRKAATSILSLQHVFVKPELLEKKRLGPTAVCPSCGEAYPLRDGESCLACQGRSPYAEERRATAP
jgi:formylmethanofuran dehydrogenase subunit E